MICIDTHAFVIIIFCKKKGWVFEPWGGGVLPYISCIGMCHPIRQGLCASGLKTGIHVSHFGELCMVFEGTMEVYERSYRFNSR